SLSDSFFPMNTIVFILFFPQYYSLSLSLSLSLYRLQTLRWKIKMNSSTKYFHLPSLSSRDSCQSI
ncbi:MAG: hypothetical protein N7Q72_06885, partial [Spiroplasma sp. Tabriz.8]|nr:hypothetical protein [Spiroplasma sp. Tabriz.8]